MEIDEVKIQPHTQTCTDTQGIRPTPRYFYKTHIGPVQYFLLSHTQDYSKILKMEILTLESNCERESYLEAKRTDKRSVRYEMNYESNENIPLLHKNG
jgi:hypothetical protein